MVWIGSDLDLPWLNECKWETAPREPPSKRMNGAKTRLEQALVASPRLPRLAWSLNSWKVPVSPSFKAKLSLNSWTFGTSGSLDSVSFCKERETTQNGSSPFVSPFPPQMLPSKKHTPELEPKENAFKEMKENQTFFGQLAKSRGRNFFWPVLNGKLRELETISLPAFRKHVCRPCSFKTVHRPCLPIKKRMACPKSGPSKWAFMCGPKPKPKPMKVRFGPSMQESTITSI